jgi:thiamine-phosphate pyrophosphorylase
LRRDETRIDFRVCLITDRGQARGGDIVAAVALALEGGIRAVQLREKDMPARELLLLAQRLRAITKPFGARLLVNGRADVAAAAGADGVHLGVRSLPPAEARRLLGPEAIIGCSTHGEREIREAVEAGADFVTFGPVYATPSKAPYGPPLGVEALSRACRISEVPVFALGGVGPANAAEAVAAGAFGVALISGVTAAADPRAAAQDLTERVEEASRRVAAKEGEP